MIGSGPAGISAADAFRSVDSDAPILVVSTDPDLPYERPPLSKDFLRGQTDDVALHPPQWFDDRAISLRLGCRLEDIDAADHAVVLGGERHGYSALVIATGASPVALPVPGGEHALQLRSLADARRLRQTATTASSAVVIGAGFIGCEVAASLALQGVSVTVVAPGQVPQEKRLGAAAGERLRRLVVQTGARYRGGVSVQGIERRGTGYAVALDDGETIACDLVLAATGVSPESSIAEAAGLVVKDSRIVAASDASTSAPDVYAVGDVALTFNDAARRHLAVEHWQDAMDQGAVAGANAAGAATTWADVPGFWSTIGEETVKYTAWGDGHDREHLVEHGNGFAVWFERGGATVGVLTHNVDDAYDAGEELIAAGQPPPVPMS